LSDAASSWGPDFPREILHGHPVARAIMTGRVSGRFARRPTRGAGLALVETLVDPPRFSGRMRAAADRKMSDGTKGLALHRGEAVKADEASATGARRPRHASVADSHPVADSRLTAGKTRFHGRQYGLAPTSR